MERAFMESAFMESAFHQSRFITRGLIAKGPIKSAFMVSRLIDHPSIGVQHSVNLLDKSPILTFFCVRRTVVATQ